MRTSNWHFFLSNRHRRSSALWRYFFGGWGLFFLTMLAAAPFVVRNIQWTILDQIDEISIRENTLNVKGLKIGGRNKDGELFSIAATSAVQKYSEDDIIYFFNPDADIPQTKNGKKIRSRITATYGKYFKESEKIILTENVRVKSSDGSTASGNAMEIDLKE
ncbi:MAG: LPS export ABC transporter periplasmic protein LptC [Rickettsiales bacterium]|jgi:LPS export ABC transporter protein LptC|nr:LPS export ABC transporter periplasmic protein LptC [Rickettsiales bacterium]